MGTVGRTSSFYVIQKQVKEQKMKNRIKYLLGVLIISPICMYSKDFNVSSPDNKIILSVNVKDRISWSVNYNSTPVILPSFISLQTKEKTLGANPHIRKSKIHTVNETITTSIYKKRIIEDNYMPLDMLLQQHVIPPKWLLKKYHTRLLEQHPPKDQRILLLCVQITDVFIKNRAKLRRQLAPQAAVNAPPAKPTVNLPRQAKREIPQIAHILKQHHL